MYLRTLGTISVPPFGRSQVLNIFSKSAYLFHTCLSFSVIEKQSRQEERKQQKIIIWLIPSRIWAIYSWTPLWLWCRSRWWHFLCCFLTVGLSIQLTHAQTTSVWSHVPVTFSFPIFLLLKHWRVTSLYIFTLCDRTIQWVIALVVKWLCPISTLDDFTLGHAVSLLFVIYE